MQHEEKGSALTQTMEQRDEVKIIPEISKVYNHPSTKCLP